MRGDYLPTVTHDVAKVIHHPSTIGALLQKRRALAFAIAAAFLVAVLSAFLIIRGASGASTQKNDSLTSGDQSSAQTTAISAFDQTQPLANDNQGGPDMSGNSNSSNSETKTSVSVNNQQIKVPENGSVTKTITNGNGTTTVNVTSNSTNSSNTNTSASTTLNVNTSTYSHTSSKSTH